MKVVGLRAEALRSAVTAIDALRRRESVTPKEILSAVRVLPLHLRRHGLLATLSFGMNVDPEEKRTAARVVAAKLVADGFARALAALVPSLAGGAGELAPGAVSRLASAPLHGYLIASRVALVMADVWVGVAESLLVTADEAPGSPAQRADSAEHAPSQQGDGNVSR